MAKTHLSSWERLLEQKYLWLFPGSKDNECLLYLEGKAIPYNSKSRTESPAQSFCRAGFWDLWNLQEKLSCRLQPPTGCIRDKAVSQVTWSQAVQELLSQYQHLELGSLANWQRCNPRKQGKYAPTSNQVTAFCTSRSAQISPKVAPHRAH